MITQMEPRHIKQVAALHYDALPNDFLPSLGYNFLERVMYKSALHSDYCKTFVFMEGVTVGGFITIAMDNTQFFKHILRTNLHWIFWYGLTKALWNFGRLKEAWDALVNAKGGNKGTALPEIFVIAVGRDFRRKGIGSKLIEIAMEYLSARGLDRCQVKTLCQNLAALAMYEMAGFSRCRIERRAQKEYIVLERKLYTSDG